MKTHSEGRGRPAGFHTGPWYRFLRRLICLILLPAFRLLYGFRIRGSLPEEALKEGCVSLCNHVHMLDCVMMGYAFRRRRMQFLTLDSNLRLPVVGHIVRWMGGIPLPETLEGWKAVYERVEQAFSEGQVLQVYPEGSLCPGCRRLRPFHKGAFTFAVKYQKPVIPCVLRQYPRWGGPLQKDRGFCFWRRGLELVILPPLRPDPALSAPQARQQLMLSAQESMRAALEREEEIGHVD